jgi:hypothetical protein
MLGRMPKMAEYCPNIGVAIEAITGDTCVCQEELVLLAERKKDSMKRLPLNASFYEIRKNRTIEEATEENDTPRNIVIFNETCVMKGRRWSSPDGDSDWPVDWDEDTFMDVYGERFPDGDVDVVTVGEGE